MKTYAVRMLVLAVGLASLQGCSTTYQKLLQDRDRKIKDLYAENAELRATHQDLHARAQGARQRINALENRLAQQPAAPAEGLDRLREELPGVDVRLDDNRLSLGINNKVTFSSGSTQLKNSAGSVLRKVAAVLKREFPGQRIIVEGHTDSDPLRVTKKRFRHNRHLSVERADAVADYLVKNCGIEESSIVVAGYGPNEPVKTGKTKVAKAANRRVEIVVAGRL